jgi:hypothetical protein
MKYLKQIVPKISRNFEDANLSENQKGIVHLDIWYDNLSVNKEMRLQFLTLIIAEMDL